MEGKFGAASVRHSYQCKYILNERTDKQTACQTADLRLGSSDIASDQRRTSDLAFDNVIFHHQDALLKPFDFLVKLSTAKRH